MESFESMMEFVTLGISALSIGISLWVMKKIEEDNRRKNGGGRI